MSAFGESNRRRLYYNRNILILSRWILIIANRSSQRLRRGTVFELRCMLLVEGRFQCSVLLLVVRTDLKWFFVLIEGQAISSIVSQLAVFNEGSWYWRINLNVFSVGIRSVFQKRGLRHTFELLARGTLHQFGAYVEDRLVDMVDSLAGGDGQDLVIFLLVIAIRFFSVTLYWSNILT